LPTSVGTSGQVFSSFSCFFTHDFYPLFVLLTYVDNVFFFTLVLMFLDLPSFSMLLSLSSGGLIPRCHSMPPGYRRQLCLLFLFRSVLPWISVPKTCYSFPGSPPQSFFFCLDPSFFLLPLGFPQVLAFNFCPASHPLALFSFLALYPSTSSFPLIFEENGTIFPFSTFSLLLIRHPLFPFLFPSY